MKLSVKWVVTGVVVALLAVGIARALSTRKANQEALAAQQALQKQQTAVEIAATDVLQARTLELTQALPITGALKAVNAAFVKAKVAGDLQGLTVREGDFVKAGQVIARIDTTETQARTRQAQQQADAARAQVDIAQRALDNNKALVNQGFISKTALDNSLANLASAQATYQAALAGADVAAKALQDTVLRAPISGQVAQRLVQNGERVGVDARVVEVVDLGALELETALSAADSVRVRAGQSAQLAIEGLTQPVAAKVVRINPSATAGSRAVLAYLQLASAAGLRQGLFAEGTLTTGTVRALSVPLDAVRTDKPQPYVQHVVDNKVAHQTVAMGVQGQHEGITMVEIKGLPDGAQVLAGTVGTLREGSLVQRTTGKP